MAEHKAPTEVTVAAHEEQSPFAAFVERHWPKAAVLALALAAGILYNQYRGQAEAGAMDRSWGLLMAELEQDPQSGRLVGSVEGLTGLATELEGTAAAPWGLFLEAQGLHEEGRDAEAVVALSRLRQGFPTHPLVTRRYKFGDSTTPITLIDQMTKAYEAEAVWRPEHPALYDNPAPAPGGPRVRIQTDSGEVLVALYAERAPKLTENFLKLCGEGFYDNTKVHRVRAGMLIEAGDPSTREDGGEDWGLGGADYTLEKTETGLSNFTGYLGMAVKQGEEDPNGSLFYLTVAPVHFFDHRYMVFGKVIEGLDVVSDISNAATEGPTGRPLNPIAILGTEVLPDA